jgi:hypothetical protein
MLKVTNNVLEEIKERQRTDPELVKQQELINQGREVKHLRDKEVITVNVIWGGPTRKNATWESETRMKESYSNTVLSRKFSRAKIL